jgi:hypothetical protein
MGTALDILEFTATGQYYKVYRDGVFVSKHTTEREAAQQAANQAFAYPDSAIHYTHEYNVTVGLTDAGITEAKDYGPGADQPPEVIGTPHPLFVEGTAGTFDFSAYISDDGQSAVTYSLTNVLPNGLSLVAETGILTYDGIGTPSVSQHQLTATDSAGSDQSLSFNITILDADYDDFDELLGNVVTQFGADPTGVADSTSAIQAAMDSDYAVFFPSGVYKTSSTITISEAKIVHCFGDYTMTGFLISSRQNFERLGENVRFKPTSDFDLFTVRNILNWRGGFMDYNAFTSPNSAAFRIPMDWLGGELGGSIQKCFFLGNEPSLTIDDVNGGYAVYVDFENYSVDGARLENWQFTIQSRYLHTNFYLTALNPGFNQSSELHRVTADYHSSKLAVHDEASNQSQFVGMMQTSAGTFASETYNNMTYTRTQETGRQLLSHGCHPQPLLKPQSLQGRQPRVGRR